MDDLAIAGKEVQPNPTKTMEKGQFATQDELQNLKSESEELKDKFRDSLNAQGSS
ncbi:conserved hypothetical protein [Ricinus communis]|uniref:Uncharacterized protein n=1 Tax=Ricinus communis TaxID=3988 RepID=B9RDA8_RICCO|nr:conserved hypothetical protein [Ricinus communis]EEF50376.1 conserved hypothetical protein [Ricinus communis]